MKIKKILLDRSRREMSWAEAVVESLQESELPQKIQKCMLAMRAQDKTAQSKCIALAKAERELLEELKALVAKGGRKFDEAAYQVRADALIARRQELAITLDDQQKKAVAVYNLLDERITTLDANTRQISHLLVNAGINGEDKGRRKRKNLGRDEESDVLREASEPTYCVCNQVSFGTMIGCDNSECPIEWFHLACVGLSEPKDPWFCPQCSGEEEGDSGKIQEMGSQKESPPAALQVDADTESETD